MFKTLFGFQHGLLIDGYGIDKLCDDFDLIYCRIDLMRVENRLEFHISFTASVIVINEWLQDWFRILLFIELARL